MTCEMKVWYKKSVGEYSACGHHSSGLSLSLPTSEWKRDRRRSEGMSLSNLVILYIWPLTIQRGRARVLPQDLSRSRKRVDASDLYLSLYSWKDTSTKRNWQYIGRCLNLYNLKTIILPRLRAVHADVKYRGDELRIRAGKTRLLGLNSRDRI